MAIAHVQAMGHGVTSASGGTHSFSPGANQSALGDTLVLVLMDQGDSISSVTDSKGNTWTVQKDQLTGGLDIAVATCIPADSSHMLVTTDTITAHCSNTGFAALWQIDEFSGLSQTLDGTPVVGTAASISGLTTTNANDLIIAAYGDFHSGAVTFTVQSGWTAGVTVDVGSPGSYHEWFQWKIVSSAGAQSAAPTISAGQITSLLLALQASGGTTYTDTPSGTLTLGGSLTESHTVADTVSGTITLGGSRTEAHTVSDSATGTITLGGSIVESKRYTDAPSGTIQLGGSSTEHFTGPTIYTDAVSGTIKLLGFTSTFQWQQDNDGDGNFVDIPGAVEQLLVVANELEPRLYLGNAVRVLVTATSNFGTVTVASEPTVPIFNSMTAAPTTSAQPSAPTKTMTPAEATAQTMTPVEPTQRVMSPTDPA